MTERQKTVVAVIAALVFVIVLAPALGFDELHGVRDWLAYLGTAAAISAVLWLAVRLVERRSHR